MNQSSQRDPAVSPAAAVQIALAQRDAIAPGSPLTDVLARTAPTTAEFWTEVAAELHRRALHLDAFDCWQKAIDVNRASVDLEDMAETLWSVSGGEGFLAEESLRVFESIGAWQDVAYLRFRLNHDQPSILRAIESALENTTTSLDWEDFWGFVEFSNIWGWYELGHYYLEHQASTKAIWAFGKALAAEPSDPALIRSVADTLAAYVRSHDAEREA